MVQWLSALFLGVVTGLTLHVLFRRWRQKRKAARRVVEAPNSAYVSELVIQRERRERWSRIALSGLHPLNRTEVEDLLRIVKQHGERGLSERQRTFLDTLSGQS